MRPQPLPWRMPLLIRISIVAHLAMLLAVVSRPHAWPWILAALVANHAVITLAGLLPRSSWLGPTATRLSDISAARNEIALTIDDGPDPEVTPQVLALLDRYGAKATFFCIGAKVARYPKLSREIVARGHALENHSQHHRHYFSLLGPAGLRGEIQTAQHEIEVATGYAPLFFRAPAGLRNPFLGPVLAHLGLRLAAWTRRGYDTRTPDADTVFRRLRRDLLPGAILLLHDGNCARSADGVPVILAVLPSLLDAARSAGLHPVTLAASLSPAPPETTDPSLYSPGS